MAPDEDPDCERIDGDLIELALTSVAPAWMSDAALRDLTAAVLEELAGMEGVVLTRGPDSAPWTPPRHEGMATGAGPVMLPGRGDRQWARPRSYSASAWGGVRGEQVLDHDPGEPDDLHYRRD